MSKKVKKVLKVIGALAIIDYFDITARGQMLSYFDEYHPEAAKDWRDDGDMPKIFKIRSLMIKKIADLWSWIYAQI